MALKGQLAEGLVLPVTSTVAKNLPLVPGGGNVTRNRLLDAFTGFLQLLVAWQIKSSQELLSGIHGAGAKQQAKATSPVRRAGWGWV